MSASSRSRRRFIGATGIVLSAPLAGLGATVVDAATSGSPSPADVDAIRALMRAHARSVKASDDFGANDRITVAVDGRSATATLHCIVQTETAIGPDCPLVDMARQQGGGVVTWREPGLVEYAFTKRADVWGIERAAFRADP